MNKSPWGIDRLQADTKAATQKQIDQLHTEARLYAICFGTAEGKKVLEMIQTRIGEQPTWSPQLGPEYGYYREGQNNVIKHITDRIKLATKK